MESCRLASPRESAAGTGAWRMSVQFGRESTRRHRRPRARLEPPRMGLPCEFWSPAAPATWARPWSRCSSSRATASGVYDSLQVRRTRPVALLPEPVLRADEGRRHRPRRRQEGPRRVDAIVHLAAIVGYPACKKGAEARSPRLAASGALDASSAECVLAAPFCRRGSRRWRRGGRSRRPRRGLLDAVEVGDVALHQLEEPVAAGHRPCPPNLSE